MSTPADRAMLLCRKLNIASVFFRNEIAEAICVAENEAWEAAVQAEREACATIAELWTDGLMPHTLEPLLDGQRVASEKIAQAIRARQEEGK